jgi:1-acyl-sn-glycerol-3-phosphate acyltransferase
LPRALLLYLIQAPLALGLTAFYAALACLAAIVDRSGRATREVGGAWSRVLLRLLRVDVSVSGAEHAPPGAAVYAANHGSALDILVIFGYLPVDFRIVYKRSLSLIPLLGWSIWLGGHVPIDRSNPLRARRSLMAAALCIRSGKSVVLFPEGTRSPDATVRRFKRGSFRLALESGAPVVPVSLAGVKAVAPSGMTSLRPGRVRLRLSPPVPVAGRALEDVDELAEEVRRIVVAGCEALESEAGKDGGERA